VFFKECNGLQTLCEPSATVFVASRGVQQFVNRVQQIVNAATTEDGSQATKDPVVEHKGWDALFGFLVVFLFILLWFCRDAFRWQRIPFGMRPDFAISGVPNCLRHPLTS
jgi:hypothetical protein